MEEEKVLLAPKLEEEVSLAPKFGVVETACRSWHGGAEVHYSLVSCCHYL